MNKTRWMGIILGVIVISAFGCRRDERESSTSSTRTGADTNHTTATGSTPVGKNGGERADEDDHDHDEVSLGTATVGDLEVTLAQGHGRVQAGRESHLVVKLPYSDQGQTIVRAWLGTNDRLRSVVSRGAYAPLHDDYDIHAVAPDPLPENVMWWIEIEKPNGAKVVGSARPWME